jgi:hypothetical protein
MLARLRSKLTYPHVVSTLALFVALGGTAYAAATIGSAEIVDESIQSVDVKNGQVKTADIALDAITSNRINNGSVLNSEIATNAVTGAKVAGNTLTGAKVANNTLTGLDIDEGELALGDLSAPAYAHIVGGQVDQANSKNVTIHETGTGFQCMSVSWDEKFEFGGEIVTISTGPDVATATIDVAGADTRDRVAVTIDQAAVDNKCTQVHANALAFQANKDGAFVTLPYYIIFS